MKFNLNEDGSKYLRVISWAQIWGQYNSDRPLDGNGNEQADLDFSVRRARVLLYAQINKDFLILTHIGLNSLNSNTMSPTGTGEGLKCFLHDVWAQYSLGKNNAVGGGLHYWNGISFEQPKHFKFNDIRQPKASLGYLGSIRSILRDT
jgi:hypothetical protein